MIPLEEIASQIVDCAFKLHVALGPGLREVVYEQLLCDELERRGLRVERQKSVACDYQGRHFALGFHADIVVEDVVIIEVKSVERFSPAHVKQVLTYLRLMNLTLGFVINFGTATFKEGVKRVVNGHLATT
jgi:GxxExxY protein